MNTPIARSPRPLGARTGRGVATIEFAICAPLLLLLMLGTVEVGRLLFQYNTLTKMVRDGARYAAKHASSVAGVVNITAQLRTETTNLIVTGNTAGTGPALLPGEVTVTVSNANEGFVSVGATYQYSTILGAALPTFGFGEGDINLAIELPATVVVRALL